MGETKAGREALTFDDDPGAGRSYWVAGGLLVVVVLWMSSGIFLPSGGDGESEQVASNVQAAAVGTRLSLAKPVTLTFRAEGQAQPDRDTGLRAEASGDIAEVLVRRGDDVLAGQVIARLSTEGLEADLERAIAEQARAARELVNAEELFSRAVATRDRVVQARATAAAAEALVTGAQAALERADIVAPFGGRIETLTIDAGEFVAAGETVGRIVDNQPLTVALQVPQQSLNLIANGQSAEVQFITGENRAGTVSFVGTAASQETRTFLAEITVANADGAIPAGISAEIVIPTGETLAHFIAPSIVSLDPDGRLGVKTVEDGAVAFQEITIVRAEVGGIWVTGLPPQAELIVVGQGYVQDGEAVVTQRLAEEGEGGAAKERNP